MARRSRRPASSGRRRWWLDWALRVALMTYFGRSPAPIVLRVCLSLHLLCLLACFAEMSLRISILGLSEKWPHFNCQPAPACYPARETRILARVEIVRFIFQRGPGSSWFVAMTAPAITCDCETRERERGARTASSCREGKRATLSHTGREDIQDAKGRTEQLLGKCP